jgi:hypothetical protein
MEDSFKLRRDDRFLANSKGVRILETRETREEKPVSPVGGNDRRNDCNPE